MCIFCTMKISQTSNYEHANYRKLMQCYERCLSLYLFSQMRKNRCFLGVAQLLPAEFESRSLAYFESMTKLKKKKIGGFSHLHFMRLFCSNAKIYSRKS